MAQCLRFVISGQSKDDRSVTLLKKAAQQASEAEIDVGWLKFSDIKNGMVLEDGVILVCETFEGPIFEKLRSSNCSIVGPLCILTCLEKAQALPASKEPLLNFAMLDLVTCCTSIPVEERKILKNYIQQMGGIMINDFTFSVTHLIAGEVGSKKYQVACDIGRQVMQPSWVYDCYEKNKFEYVVASDEVFQKHRCPCFKGITICVTGLSADVRQEIKKLTEENGGKYSGDLNMRTCTHLIVKHAKGEKYNYARQWKINCVSPLWFFDCVKSGFWLKEDEYKVKPGEESTLDESKIFNSSRTRVNLTVQSEIDTSVASNKAARVAEKRMQIREEKISLERLEKSVVKEMPKEEFIGAGVFKIKCYDMSHFDANRLKISVADIFLDGCKLYLSGLPTHIVSSLRKVINGAGAMWFSQLSESITHIILGDALSKDVEDFLQKNIQKPHIVSPEWLIDSCKAGEHLNEQDYSLIEYNNHGALPSESSKLHDKQQIAAGNQGSRKATDHMPSFQVEDDIDDDVFLGQYLPQAESSRISFQPDKKNLPGKAAVAKKKISIDFQEAEQTEAIAGSNEFKEATRVTEHETEGHIFNGHKFVIKFFDEKQKSQIKLLLEECGGELSKTEAKSDHIIVPFTHEKKRRITKKEVTVCWLEQSSEKETLLEISSSFLFRPFYLPQDCLPLENSVLTVSQFTGMEREHLIQLADLLGALVQENFVRNATNGMRANTHLLLMEASGAKYEAACKWGVSCVSKEWLFACAAKRAILKTEKYPLRNGGIDEEDLSLEIEDETTKSLQQSTILESKVDETDRLTKVKPETEQSHVSKDVTFGSEGLQVTKPNFDQETAKVEIKAGPSRKNPLLNPLLQKQTGDSPLPGRRIRVSSSFRPNFDLKEAMEFLKSPSEICSEFFEKKLESDSSSSDESYYSEQIRKALEFSERCGTKSSVGSETRKTKEEINFQQEKDTKNQRKSVQKQQVDINSNKNGILDGVIMAVSKKLAHQRIELHNLASALGADCRFVFDESCTHLIHQGKQNDATSEVILARSRGKFIVSSYWLEACLDENTHVEEKLYPSTYNPKMAIEVMPVKRRASKSTAPSPSVMVGKRGKDISALTDTVTGDISAIKEDIPCVNLSPKFVEPHDAGKTSSDANDASNKQAEPAKIQLPSSSPCFKDTSSLDARIEFKRHMEEIMKATKGNKEDSRRSRRHLQSRRLRSRQSSQRSSNESSRSSNDKINQKAAGFQSIEPSQGDIISYDDPAGRMERERILAQLKAASPSQDVYHDFQHIEECETDVDACEKQPLQFATETALTVSSRKSEEQIEPSTPQPPPINLQITRPIQPPEPVNLLEQEQTTTTKQNYSMTHRFLLSAMTPQEKIRYSALIEELSGVLCDAQYFTMDCTHVVAGTPNRNEKFLASVAAGKWVLHKSYLEASREAGFFVDEELHEWGTEAEPSKLSSAAYRWRKKLSLERKRNPSAGAFEGWQVLLCVGSTVLQHGFKRMLEAGGGIVKSISPPFNNIEGVTHAFVDQNKVKPGNIDFKALHSAGIWVLRTDYIAEYLTQDPPPPMLKYVIKEVQKLSELDATQLAEISVSDPKKRKNQDERSSQRSKRTKK